MDHSCGRWSRQCQLKPATALGQKALALAKRRYSTVEVFMWFVLTSVQREVRNYPGVFILVRIKRRGDRMHCILFAALFIKSIILTMNRLTLFWNSTPSFSTWSMSSRSWWICLFFILTVSSSSRTRRLSSDSAVPSLPKSINFYIFSLEILII